VLRYLHPAIIEELGGLEQARAELEPLARQKKTVESFGFPRPPDFLQAGARRFAIVPTLMVLRAGDQRIESLNYQVGVLDPGASGWKYVDGSQISSANVRRLFPDFPADYQFPSFYRRKL